MSKTAEVTLSLAERSAIHHVTPIYGIMNDSREKLQRETTVLNNQIGQDALRKAFVLGYNACLKDHDIDPDEHDA